MFNCLTNLCWRCMPSHTHGQASRGLCHQAGFAGYRCNFRFNLGFSVSQRWCCFQLDTSLWIFLLSRAISGRFCGPRLPTSFPVFLLLYVPELFKPETETDIITEDLYLHNSTSCHLTSESMRQLEVTAVTQRVMGQHGSFS